MSPVFISRKIDGGDPNIDAISALYLLSAVFYTLFVICELLLLYQNRTAWCMRIRNVKATYTAVWALHVYLIIILLVYPLNGTFPCSAEYWIMSIVLPLGMAVFQVCNAQVLKVYQSQKRFSKILVAVPRRKRISSATHGICKTWLGLDAASKVQWLTYAGLGLSLVSTTVLFFASRRFHPAFGLFGPVVDDRLCRRGLEWLPSIVLQVFFSALVGPWILWKIRNVRDVHLWAWQTRLAVVAGLPGTPLWLIFLYRSEPGMGTIDGYFPQAGWFIPGLVTCQQALIIIPLIEVYRRSKQAYTRQVGRSTSEAASSVARPKSPKGRSVEKFDTLPKTKSSLRALDAVIDADAEPLITWAATHEFTAENIAFLREVRNFRRKWSGVDRLSASQKRQMHEEGALIFSTLISPHTAHTPINIDHKILKKLEGYFEPRSQHPYMPSSQHHLQMESDSSAETLRANVICPWEGTPDEPQNSGPSAGSESPSNASAMLPSGLAASVFDQAYESIKYLVLTNTWPRYVNATSPTV